MKGTPEQFMNELEDTINNLKGITSYTEVIDDGEDVIIASSQEGSYDSYLDELERVIEDDLSKYDVSTSWNKESNNLSLDVVLATGDILSFTIPFDDLSGDIAEDYDYILGEVEEEISSYQDYTDDVALSDDEDTLDSDSDEWEYVTSKSVQDSDGFYTDYTMYKNSNDEYIFIFGDKDSYGPDNTDPDWECDSEREAYEWFESYNGFDENGDN